MQPVATKDAISPIKNAVIAVKLCKQTVSTMQNMASPMVPNSAEWSTLITVAVPYCLWIVIESNA